MVWQILETMCQISVASNQRHKQILDMLVPQTCQNKEGEKQLSHMVCQCGGTGKGIKSKVGGELDISLQALFTYLCDLCAFDCVISPLILLFFNTWNEVFLLCHPRHFVFQEVCYVCLCDTNVLGVHPSEDNFQLKCRAGDNFGVLMK